MLPEMSDCCARLAALRFQMKMDRELPFVPADEMLDYFQREMEIALAHPKVKNAYAKLLNII